MAQLNLTMEAIVHNAASASRSLHSVVQLADALKGRPVAFIDPRTGHCAAECCIPRPDVLAREIRDVITKLQETREVNEVYWGKWKRQMEINAQRQWNVERRPRDLPRFADPAYY